MLKSTFYLPFPLVHLGTFLLSFFPFLNDCTPVLINNSYYMDLPMVTVDVI